MLSGFGAHCSASSLQLSLNFFGGTYGRASNHLLHKVVFSAAGNSWSPKPFPVLENSLISISHNCNVHSCLANLLCDLMYRQ